MKKTFIFCLLAAFAVPTFADENDGAMQLIYPMAAADTELDNSTPAKRITPPVREDSEYDPISPIGQIRDIVNTLNKLEDQQDSILETVGKLQLGETKDLLPFLERGAKQGDAIGSNVETLLESSKSIATKIESLQATMADLRATVESVEKTAASVERIRTSRWTDYAVIAILALVIIQLVWRVGASLVAWIKGRAARVQELMAALEVAKQQLAAKEAKAKTEK